MKTRVVNRNIIMSIFAVLLLIFGVQGLSHGQDAPETIVQFSDRSLAIMVGISIAIDSNKPPNLIELKRMPEAEVLKIPQAELTKLTNLIGGKDVTSDLRLPAITDLTGLEHATQLRTINLWGQNVIDLTPLSQLTQLTRLDLSWIEIIRDITPLSQLTQLSKLNLFRNRIIDIAPLAQLTQLTKLNLGGGVMKSATSAHSRNSRC